MIGVPKLMVTALASFALVAGNEDAQAKAPRSFFGVSPAGEVTGKDARLMARGRIGIVRKVFHWPTIRPDPNGPYRWAPLDHIVRNLARNGIKTLPVLLGTPRWLADHPDRPPVRTKRQRTEWRKFVRAAIRRYGTGGVYWQQFKENNPGFRPRPIRTWEIWNEINSSNYYSPRPRPNGYARLLEATSRVARQADPHAKLMVAGMFGTPWPDRSIAAWKFMRRVYAVPGIKKHFDIVGLHPYAPSLSGIKEQVRRMRNVMRRAGDRRTPVWITELGWGSNPRSPGRQATTQRGQKRMLKRSLQLFLRKRQRWRVRGYVWFAWKDVGQAVGVCDWCSHAGLRKRNLSPKPAWSGFTRFSRR